MSEMWKSKSPELLRYWIAECAQEKTFKTLTAWEKKFIIDMSDNIVSGRTLTSGQQVKLEEIYAERTK